MSPTLVALTGLAGAGKSTAAAILAKHHGFTRMRFAAPLKAMLRAIGLGDAEIEGHLKEAPCALLQGKSPRQAMQTLGTEWGRNLIGEHFWADVWQHQALQVLDQGGKVVVEDCRFPNEVAAIKSLGGKIWRVDRPGLVVGTHDSEQYVAGLKADDYIHNSGTLDRLSWAICDNYRRVWGWE
jgi:hypothetical protein